MRHLGKILRGLLGVNKKQTTLDTKTLPLDARPQRVCLCAEPRIRMIIHCNYEGATGAWHVYLDDEEVHQTKDEYQRDMFIAELKARIKIIESEAKARGLVVLGGSE